MVNAHDATSSRLACAATKRTRSARAAGRSSATQQTQALLLGIAFTVYRLRLRRHFALLLP